MAITRYCAELLEAASRYHVHYGDRLANHLPMVLIALDKMGASREQLQQAFDRSAPLLESPRLPPPNPEVAIGDCRNREQLLPTAIDYYQHQLCQLGIAECLRRELPPLLPAIASAAFHPLIRTAYGVDANHQQEIATGLAYWNLEYRTLPTCDHRIEVPAAEIPSLLAYRYPTMPAAPGNIAAHMAAVTHQSGWLDTPVQPQQLDLQAIAQVALSAYRNSGDFTLLHGVTGCHALRLLLDYCTDPEAARRYFWSGLVIAFLSTNTRQTAEETPTESMDWGELRTSACGSRDTHVIKLTYSCWREEEYYANPDYRHLGNL
ncbi:questin oxidase family protein [Microbulbifer sp. 2201CG32-9]|uniref:questin oxidase family protein n=1 Tax=Microbulbifer sp. 2201CG32-9 TaxID=3232309 RepID=UPI00345B696F